MSRILARPLFLVLVAAVIGAAVPSVEARQAASHLDIDGADDYLTVADHDRLSFGTGTADTPLTIEAWVWPDTWTGSQVLVGKSYPAREYRLLIASGVLRLDLLDASASAAVSAFTSTNLAGLQGWHHVAATYDGRSGATAADGITLYVDGAAVPLYRQNNPAYVAMENGSSDLQVGREGPNYRHYSGGLDELRLWNIARTQAQIQAALAEELGSGMVGGLAAYWKFNEGVGAAAADEAPGGLTAMLFGAPLWVAGGPAGPADPDLEPPQISNITATNLTHQSITIGFTTNEATTGWVSLTPTGTCPCTEVYSPVLGTTHLVTVSGLTADTFYTYDVRAADGAENLTVGPTMSFRTLVVPTDVTPPTVSISSPAAGNVSGTVPVTALATDDVGVVGVQFRLDGLPLGPEVLTAPYTVSWDTSLVADGSYTLTADARDAAGHVATATLMLTVVNDAGAGAPYYVQLDGADDYLTVADADALSFGNGVTDTPLTIEAWIRPNTMSGGQVLVGKTYPSLEYRLLIAGGALRLDLRDASASATVSAFTSTSQAALQGSWHHVAATYDGRGGADAADGIAIYVDGAAVPLYRQNNPAYLAMENGSSDLQVGREGPSYWHYGGGLDELRLWNIARTQTQIQAAKDAELNSGIATGLVAYWKFNEGNGASVADEGPGGLTATLFGAPLWVAGGPVSPADPDVEPPQIGNITAINLTHTGITIGFTTNEPTTGSVSFTPTGTCPCTEVYSPVLGTTHVVTVTGLTPDTFYTYDVRAADAAENLTVGPAMSFRTLVMPTDTTPPAVSISSPAPGSVSGAVPVTALASDDVGVVGVQFLLDGAPLGIEVATAPYSITWDSSTVADGPHTLTANVRDAAGHLATVTIALTVANTPGASSPHYLELDGVDDYLTVADADALSFGNGVADTALTIEAWIRPNTMRGQVLVGKTYPALEYRLLIAGGALRLDLSDASASAVASVFTSTSQAALQGSWHHVAATYDGRGGATAADGITIYVDGVAVPLYRQNNPAYVAMENGSSDLQVGREGPSYWHYGGGLDELRLWNVARTQAQIQGHMSFELADGTEPGLVAYWKFNQGGGDTATDESPNGLTATLFGGPTWVSGGPAASNADQASAITSAASAAFQIGLSGTFTVTATGMPAPTLVVTGVLAPGVTFTDNGDGTAVLAGVPESGSAGDYLVTVTATNGVGAPATQNLAVTVNETTAITSAASAAFQVGAAGSFTLTATGFPAPTFLAVGTLPAGVTFADQGNGTATLTGTPATGAGGSYALVVTATNNVGAPATQTFTLTISEPVSITSASSVGLQIGVPGTFNVTALGFPVPALTLSGTLPGGVAFMNHGNGMATVSGTPAAGSGGSYLVSVAATNGVGVPVTQALTLTVTQAAAITSASSAAFLVGSPGSFTVSANGSPVPAISAAGVLPAGVTFSDLGNGTATLAGTPAPDAGGGYALTITATNGVGASAVQSFTLTVQACTLSPAAGPLPAGSFGAPYSLAFTGTGGTAHTFALAAGTLPAGLSLSGGGSLSGTPGDTGTFSFTVTATNAAGCAASNLYSLTVAPDAQDESFGDGVGNTQYSVGAGAPPTPAVVVSGSVLSNDGGTGALAAGPASIATASGGHVAMSATGAFLYTPPPGFAGPSDTFTYTVTDGSGLSDTAVVTLGMGNAVWYVNGGGPAGDGRSHSPFNDMASASNAALPGHVIYVHLGSAGGATLLKQGQVLWGAGASFTLNGLFIASTVAPTLGGTVTLANDVVLNGVAVHGGAGPAIVATGLTGIETLSNVSIAGGATGLTLTSLAGTMNVVGGLISGVTGTDVLISGGTGTLAIGSAITNTAGRSIDVQNRTAGTITFAGAITDSGHGIFLGGNTGSAIAFTGGMSLSTGTNDAFTAIGGGTVTATQDNTLVLNTLSTTSGTALRIVHTGIGAAGLTFRSITAGTSTPSAGAGIVLDSTGVSPAHGGLAVVGNGTAFSGGWIRRKTGDDGSAATGVGVYLNQTKAPALAWMRFTDFANSAIVGRELNGFTLSDVLIEGVIGTTTGQAEGPVVLGLPGPDIVNGLTGSGLLRNVIAVGGVGHNVAIYNHSGAMTLRVEGTDPAMCSVSSNSTTTGLDGMLVQLDGTATGAVDIERCRFRNNRMAGLRALAEEDSSLEVNITQSQLIYSPGGQGTQGFVIANAGNAHLTTSIVDNSFVNHPGTNILIGQAPGNATALSMLRATITGNSMNRDTPPSTTPNLVARLSSTIGQVAPARILIQGNHILSGGATEGIHVSTPDAQTSPAVDVTITNNHVDVTDDAGPRSMRLEATQAGASMCANVQANISHHITHNPGGIISAVQSNGATYALERGGQDISQPAAIVLEANNELDTTDTEVIGVLTVVENGTCQLPSAP